jgi:O-succinylbenzoate synthase
LDFNARTSFNQLSAFLNALGSHLEWIDFIEDPCPFEARTWTFIQKQWNVRLALDCIPFGFKFEALLDRSAVSVFIIKPAIQDTNRLFQVADRLQMPIVVTSYLDHPLGQVCAAWIAAQRRRIGPHHLLETCGLVSHMAYDSHPFSEQLGAWTPQLKLPLGTGFGFDKLLKEQKWERV